MKTIIQTPTNDLENSLEFYRKLGFTLVSEKGNVFTDGKALISINADRFARAGLKLFNANWKEAVAELEKLTTVLKIEQGYLLNDSSGMWIYLIEQEEGIDFTLAESSTSVLGNYAGLSLECIAIEESIKIFKILGFAHSSGAIEQGWVSLSNEDGVGISIMVPNSCPHLFFNPSLTYFNGGKNDVVINKVRELEIPITEEITQFNAEGIVDNIIIRDPGGFGFFVFND